MGKSLLATCATVVTFLAFAFQLIGCVSTPVTRKISLAQYNGYQYGWGGVCSTDLSKECSNKDISIGYTLHDQSYWYFKQNGQKILSELLVSHVVAAGCLLLGTILVGTTHIENRGLRLAAAIIMVPFFLVTLLSFLVEILLWGTKLQFAGWFTLAATVLSAVSLAILFVLSSSRDRKPGKADRGKVEMSRGGSFVIGALSAKGLGDEEKLINPVVNPIKTKEITPYRNFDRHPQPINAKITHQPPRATGGTAGTGVTPIPPPHSNSQSQGRSQGQSQGRDGAAGRVGGPRDPQDPHGSSVSANPQQQSNSRPTIPTAGALLPGVDDRAGGYGPNVVGIPKVRSNTAQKSSQIEPVAQLHQSRQVYNSGNQQMSSQTAVYDYATPNERHSPPRDITRNPNNGQPGIPNYSRLTNSPQLRDQQSPQLAQMAQAKQQLVEHYVSTPYSGGYSEPAVHQYAFKSGPPSPGGSEASHYTSASQRAPPGYAPQPPMIPTSIQPMSNYQQPQMMMMASQQPSRSDIALQNNPDFSIGGGSRGPNRGSGGGRRRAGGRSAY